MRLAGRATLSELAHLWHFPTQRISTEEFLSENSSGSELSSSFTERYARELSDQTKSLPPSPPELLAEAQTSRLSARPDGCSGFPVCRDGLVRLPNGRGSTATFGPNFRRESKSRGQPYQ